MVGTFLRNVRSPLSRPGSFASPAFSFPESVKRQLDHQPSDA